MRNLILIAILVGSAAAGYTALDLFDMAAHSRRMVGDGSAAPGYLPVRVWTTDLEDGVLLSIDHPERVCCLEAYIPAPLSFDWTFSGFPPWDFFDTQGMAYRIIDLPPDHPLYPECQHQGQAIASYHLGQMLDQYRGPVGVFTGTPPLVFGHNPGCQIGEADLVVYSGIVPAWPLEVQLDRCGPGDFDGDQVVGVLDFLYVLARWSPANGPFDIGHVLAILANWSQ